jgi:16S rRNA (uracil1498-N3)-methyltransferase
VTPRFYAPDARTVGDVISLPHEEAEHLTRVLRLKRGDSVIVFNGRGLAFDAIVESAHKNAAAVSIGTQRSAAPEPRVAITLVQSVLKGDKMDDIVRDSVMIGVSAIQPVIATRSEVSQASLARGRRRERWARIAVSSAKQCGRAVVPVILPPEPFEEVHRFIDDRRLPAPALMLVEPGAAPGARSLRELGGQPPRTASVLIGPEGGWTDDEIGEASERCRLLTLGGRTVRADAMALVAVAALFARWEEY